MGLDLTLLPFEADHEDGFSFAHTVLNCIRRGDLFEAIMEQLNETPVPANFYSYLSRDGDGDSHYNITTTTPYGEPLGYVRVADLLGLSEHVGVLDNQRNRAIWAYLGQLSGRTLVRPLLVVAPRHRAG
jgi:hypothetical protein